MTFSAWSGGSTSLIPELVGLRHEDQQRNKTSTEQRELQSSLGNRVRCCLKQKKRDDIFKFTSFFLTKTPFTVETGVEWTSTRAEFGAIFPKADDE